jgi:hypothetical protein
MIRIRPLAGAVLMTLALPSIALAATVEIIGPGAAGTGPRDESTTTLPRTTASSSDRTSYSPAEFEPLQPGLQTRHFGGVTLSCKVASTSTDLVVVNDSLEPLPPGTRIKWQLRNEGTRGFFAIIGELGGGESLVADGVLDGRAGQDETCVARVI